MRSDRTMFWQRASIRLNQGNAYLSLRKFDKALECMRSVVAAKPDYAVRRKMKKKVCRDRHLGNKKSRIGQIHLPRP